MAHRYVDRGIDVCPEWRASFQAFIDHVGQRPSPELTIERINNDRGYEPGNVRWAPWIDQMNNMCRNHFLTYGGRTMTMAQWSRETGQTYKALSERIYRGWPIARALGFE